MAKKAYIGVTTEVPIYETTTETVQGSPVNINSYSTLKNYFTVENDDYYWFYFGSYFCSNNGGEDDSTAITWLTAKKDMTVSFSYSVSSESGWDKFTIIVGNTYVANEISGDTSNTYSGSISKGDIITFMYSKDGSYSEGTDCAEVWGMTVTCPEEREIQTQVGTEIKDVARKIKKGYIGINTEIPIYGTGATNVDITASNISNYFTVSNGSYYFADDGSGEFTTTNGGVNSSMATTYLTAKANMTVSFTYSYSSEASYDKFTLAIAGTVIENAVSGSTTSKTYTGTLSAGQVIAFEYSKDTSQHSYNDECKFYDMTVTTTGQVQTGSEFKEVARRIKKAYIGIGGKARPCWNGGELTYYGTTTGLSTARCYLAATNVGNYALFGGGYTGSVSSVVDAYNKNLTRSTPTAFSAARRYLAATSVGDYALFGGGYSSSSYQIATIEAYDKSLTKTNPTNLSTARYYLEATSVGDYALFGGGYTGSVSAAVDAYSKSLTRTTPTSLNTSRRYLAATSVGGYALFGGGYTSSSYSNVVDAYNMSLTRTIPTALSTARRYLAATSVGDYALFGGGYNGSVSSVVDAYNKSLTRTTATALSTARQQLAATSIGNYALFGGGYINSGYTKVVDAYDKSLTRSTATSLNATRCNLAAVSVDDYALFGGGNTTGYSSVVDVYTLV